MAEDGGQKKDAPKFMVLYCSIMILLLAFFIILQAFAPKQEVGLFHVGQGSFVRALKTFGLGRVMGHYKRGRTRGSLWPHYYKDASPRARDGIRSRDPELDRARAAMSSLKDQMNQSENLGEGEATLLATSYSQQQSTESLRENDVEFLKALATRAMPVLLRRGCIVSFGGFYRAGKGDEAEAAREALALAEKAGSRVFEHLPVELKEKARQSTYTFCRPRTGGHRGEDFVLQIQVNRRTSDRKQE